MDSFAFIDNNNNSILRKIYFAQKYGEKFPYLSIEVLFFNVIRVNLLNNNIKVFYHLHGDNAVMLMCSRK